MLLIRGLMSTKFVKNSGMFVLRRGSRATRNSKWQPTTFSQNQPSDPRIRTLISASMDTKEFQFNILKPLFFSLADNSFEFAYCIKIFELQTVTIRDFPTQVGFMLAFQANDSMCKESLSRSS